MSSDQCSEQNFKSPDPLSSPRDRLEPPAFSVPDARITSRISPCGSRPQRPDTVQRNDSKGRCAAQGL